MSLVTHKYTPAEISEAELDATFAARGHTVDYLLKSLRDQIHTGTLSSFVVTGPRGAGKSTVIRMGALRLRRDPELSGAWLPVVFPEEQFSVASLRDFLAAILRELSAGELPEAKAWLEKVEAESNDEQSQQLAITGLRELTRKAGRRLVVFVENLNLLLEECLDDQMKGTLRRLLMTDPFMMLIGSSVHVFDSLKSYDEAFFNYFGPVPLDRLTAEQVFELLQRRAEFDGNERFLRDFREQRPKIRAIVHLSGGNPRLILMLYELLSQRQVTTIVQCLRRLVDELTPLLKDEMENLPPQQRKIVHALMEKGGTAQPADLVERTRLPLNAITTQLKRLKDAQIVELLGGGKGRAANYTVPDKLFAIWYQMRYLNQNRRRIELFVEVLRIWFEAEERLATLRRLAADGPAETESRLRETATMGEYLAASLQGTQFGLRATDLCVGLWVKAHNVEEAGSVFVDLLGFGDKDAQDRPFSQVALSVWLTLRDSPQKAHEILDPLIKEYSLDPNTLCAALIARGFAANRMGDHGGAIRDFSAALGLPQAPPWQLTQALIHRGSTKSRLNDPHGAIADFTAVLTTPAAPTFDVAQALFNRAHAKRTIGDAKGELADLTAVTTLEGVSKVQLAEALVSRGFAKGKGGDTQGELADYTAVITLEGATKEVVVRALVNRSFARAGVGDTQGALADCTAVLELDGAPKEGVVRALLNRGAIQMALDQKRSAIADWTKVLELGASDDAGVSLVAEKLFRFLWLDGDVGRANEVLARLVEHLATMPPDQRVLKLTDFLARLASPAIRQGWPHAARRLLGAQPPEARQSLAFLEPVCAVLEGGQKSLLDPLPPEQREFALQVLTRFDAEKTPPTAPSSDDNLPKPGSKKEKKAAK